MGVSSNIKMCKSSKLELTHLRMVASSADFLRTFCGGAPDKLLKVGQVKEIYELKGAGRSIREIARELDVSRNTVRRYLKSPEAMRPKARPPRGSKLDPHLEYIDLRMAEGLENCRVLDREIRALGYQGSYSTVVQYVRPRRRCRQPEATMRFETAPGEQAQVDWGSLSYIGADGKKRRVWVFVMTLGWSRASPAARNGPALRSRRQSPARCDRSLGATRNSKSPGGRCQPGLHKLVFPPAASASCGDPTETLVGTFSSL